MGIYKSKVLNLAMGEVGYKEKKSPDRLDDFEANAGSGNYTKYWRDLCPSNQGNAWCQCFIDWLFNSAFGEEIGKALTGQSGKTWTYYTPEAVKRAKAAGLWHDGVDDIQEGDILYFYGYVSSENRNRIHHVGIVYKVNTRKIFTIEGNASDGVNLREYLRENKSLYGYIRPGYDPEVNPDELIGWHHDSIGGWWYRCKEGRGAGTFYRDGFYKIKDSFYAFDKEGYLIYDARKIAIDPQYGVIYVR